MEIDDKVVVHKIQYPETSKALDEFKILTIVKIRNDVPGMWGGNSKYTGYKAEDEEGHTYSQYWYSYPSDAIDPINAWSPEEKDDCTWYDVIQVRGLTAKPKWLKGEFAKIIYWCGKHTMLYYDECLYCFFERESPDKKEEYKKHRNIARGW
jgi:hypothetical protein